MNIRRIIAGLFKKPDDGMHNCVCPLCGATTLVMAGDWVLDGPVRYCIFRCPNCGRQSSSENEANWHKL